MIKRIVKKSFKCIPYSLIKTLCKKSLFMPFYHLISDEEVSHVKHLYKYRRRKQFIQDLDFFSKEYSVIELKDLQNLDATSSQSSKPKLFLSFDDGFREMHEIVAPILKQKGIPATFFINSAFLDNKNFFYRNKASVLIETFSKGSFPSALEKIQAILSKIGIHHKDDFRSSILAIPYAHKMLLDEIGLTLGINFEEYLTTHSPYMTSDQVRDLIKDGFDVGAHSVDHPPYSQISLEDQFDQTKRSLQALLDNFQLNTKAFAFPFNDAKVSQRFFNEIYQHIDLSFGTYSMSEENHSLHFHRSCMENFPSSAKKITLQHYHKLLFRKLRGKNVIRRTG